MKAGQKITSGKLGSSKISVSNIVVKSNKEAGWPAWAKKQNSLVKAYIKKRQKFMDWDDLKEDVEDEFGEDSDDEYVR